MENEIKIVWNSKYYIGNQKIPLKRKTENTIYHYTTKVIELDQENKIKALDGFSFTDRNYIDYDIIFSKKLWDKITIYFRMPKYGNSAFLISHKDQGILIPEMSFDIAFYGIQHNDYDIPNFYLKPILKRIGFKDVDSLLENALVINQYGYVEKAKNLKPQYFPYLKELAYDKPDITIKLFSYDIYSNTIYENLIDVYNKYYFNVIEYEHPFWGRRRELLTLGYIFDLFKLDVIPKIELQKYQIDAWRGFYQNIHISNENDKWVKLTDSEWCGSGSESSILLEEMENTLLKLLLKGIFEYVVTVISYTSNIFVVYIDFYVKKTNLATNIVEYHVKNLIDKIQKVEIKEILENIFHLK
jgi:hypothetical protein